MIFGLVSPYCALCIAFGIILKVTITRRRVLHYMHVQFHYHPDGKMQNSKDEIENICRNAYEDILRFFFPGLILATMLFSLYVFDMAADVDELSELGASLSLLIIINAAIMRIRMSFFSLSGVKQIDDNERSRTVEMLYSSVKHLLRDENFDFNSIQNSRAEDGNQRIEVQQDEHKKTMSSRELTNRHTDDTTLNPIYRHGGSL